MTRTHRLARRVLPVVVDAPMQLPLALRWDHPIDQVHAAPVPGPAPVVALRRRRAA